MIVYSVYDTNRTFRNACELLPDKKWNNLLSYWYFNKNTPMKQLFQHSNNLLFDSGAFTLFGDTHRKISLDNYFKQYKSFVEKYCNQSCVRGFIELDIGSIVGYDTVLDYRGELLEVSDKILPCWHQYLGLDEYKKLVHEYDYIAIGGIANNELNRDYLPALNKYAMNHNCKIHALGVGAEKYLRNIPFHSVDTSIYITTRYGKIFQFQDGLQKKTRVNKNYLTQNNKKVRLFNFLQSIKLQEYYQTLWENKQ